MGTAARPWWLAEEAACPFCLQGHAVEVTVHCVRCDRPVCPICVVEVRRVALCPECGGEAAR